MLISKKMLAAGSGETHFILTISDDSVINALGLPAIGPEDDIYVRGSNELMKIDTNGELQWAKSFVGMFRGNDVGVDSSGNAYVVGDTTVNAFNTRDVTVSKFNSSGALQWSRNFGQTNPLFAFSIVTDSSGNSYAASREDTDGGGGMVIQKIDTDGDFQWALGYGQSGGTNRPPYGLAIDSSGDLIFCGSSRDTNNTSEIMIGKIDTATPALDWVLHANYTITFYNAATDSSNNVYAVGVLNTGAQSCLVTKTNSSGVVQWTKAVGTSDNQTGVAIAVDENDDVYVVATGTVDGVQAADDILVYKLDSSGDLIWGRAFQHSTALSASGIQVNSKGSLVISGNGNGGSVIIKMDPNGLGIGVYDDFTYADITHSSTTYSLVDSPISAGIGTSSYFEADTGFTAGDLTPTTDLQLIQP